MIRSKLFLIILLFCAASSWAQSFEHYLGDEASLFAQTKQINQFFRRFNGEESVSGVRFPASDPNYRSITVRKNYLQMIFDLESQFIDKDQKNEFIYNVTKDEEPIFLDFHNGDWFAEVSTEFLYYGENTKATLFLKLEEENQGYKWVITNVFFKPFRELFSDESDGKLRFIHPLSHELDFMNLIKVFKETGKVTQYTSQSYKPDYLSVFLYEVKKQNLIFQNVNGVKFHFFQVPGWYFELSEIRRSGPNSGWLITGLIDFDESKKSELLKYIYYE
ncbi:MAG: hypothetical protein WBJ84_08235 [Bacteroidales bacterium]